MIPVTPTNATPATKVAAVVIDNAESHHIYGADGQPVARALLAVACEIAELRFAVLSGVVSVR